MVKRYFPFALFAAVYAVLLAPKIALALQGVPDVPPDAVATALTSGMVGPMVGGAIVLCSWLLARYRNGVPLLDQLKHARDLLLPKLPAALASGGGLLMIGAHWTSALSVALTALFMSAGMSKKAPQ